MVNPSNAYAEKIFAEYPNGLWALDDTCDYISLISETNRNLSTWSKSGGSTTISSYSGTDSPINSYSSNVSITSGTTVTFTGPQFSSQLDSFSIGFWMNQTSGALVTKVEIGYTANSVTTYDATYSVPSSLNTWSFYSSVFSIAAGTTGISPVIRITYSGSINVVFNGISIGCQSEQFNSQSLGVSPEIVPNGSIPITSYGIKAYNYGSSSNYGYYLSSDSKLYAKNTGIPMVYGAYNSTILYPNDTYGEPSLIIPGFGFLNSSGQYSTTTFEAWLKIDSKVKEPRRIFGPIAKTSGVLQSNDGLYVYDSQIMLKLGSKMQSFQVFEWNRPMLVQIQLINGNASVFINGEQVISMDISNESLNFIDKYNGAIDQDWLGFYAYTDEVLKIEIDCVAIYPYQINESIAKKRYVYGQGVQFPANMKTAYNGTSVYIDYALAGYTKNYMYPNFGKWEQGISKNFVTSPTELSSPQYPLPEFRTSIANGEDLATLYSQWISNLAIANATETTPFMSLNTAYTSGKNSFLYYDSFNIIKEKIKAFYGIFSSTVIDTTKELLFKVENIMTLEALKIYVQYVNTDPNNPISTVSYVYYSPPDGDTVVATASVEEFDNFAVGIDIDAFSQNYSQFAYFFSNPEYLRMYIGGDTTSNGNETFKGKILKIGFCDAYNLEQVMGNYNFGSDGVLDDQNFIDGGLYNTVAWDDIFDAGDISNPEVPQNIVSAGSGQIGEVIFWNGGAYNQTTWSEQIDGGFSNDGTTILELFNPNSIYEHYATHTIKLAKIVDTFRMDSDTYSYWEDYVPIQYFASMNSSKNIDIDFVQINLDYPDFKIFNGTNYDTSTASIRSYITFQYVSAGANAPIGSFTNTQSLVSSKYVIPGTDWATTKYEILDGSIIYMPQNLPSDKTVLDLAIVVHIEVNSKNSISSPVKIRSLQLASRTLDEATSTSNYIYNTSNLGSPINTKFGNNIYAYNTDSNKNYIFKTLKSPMSIYKSTSPYLYLTGKTGFKPLKQISDTTDSGVMIPLNLSQSNNFAITSIQSIINHDELYFPTSPTKMFEVQLPDRSVVFYISSANSSNTRGKITAKEETATVSNDYSSKVNYYINGVYVKNPVLNVNEWTALTIEFIETLNYSGVLGDDTVPGSTGVFKVRYPILVNNLSYYVVGKDAISQQVDINSWTSATTNRYWGDTAATNDIADFPWSGVLYSSSSKVNVKSISPITIYKIYTGTNKTILNSNSSKDIRLHGYQYDVYLGINSDTKLIKPV